MGIVNLYEGKTPEVAVPLDDSQSAREARLWGWLDTMARESAKVRSEEAEYDKFGDMLDLFYGRHWPSTMPSYKPPVVANELRSLILSEASDLADATPRVYITKDPRKGGRDKVAEAAFYATWARNAVDLEYIYASVWALTVGTGFMQARWNPDLAGGLGDVEVFHRDPRTILPDPDCVDDKRWAFVGVEEYLDLAEVWRLFPVSGRDVNPEEEKLVTGGGPSTVSLETSRSGYYVGPLYEGMGTYLATPAGYKKNRVRVLDFLVKDPAVQEISSDKMNPDGTTARDENGRAILEVKVTAKYPRGRRIVGANGKILFDGPNPNPGGDFGLVRVILEPALSRFWSQGFTHQTGQLQLSANKLLSSIVENAIRLNNGVIVATGNTGLDWESFAGIPAQILRINPGSQLDIKYPNPMPPDMVQAPWRMLDLQRRILGFSDARTGVPGRGNVSSDLTETEIAQSQSITRLRARLMYDSIKRLAEMIFARMAYGYTTTRVIPSVSENQFDQIEWEPLEHPQNYSLYVDPASFTVMSRTMLRRLSTLLFKLKAIDRKALLETIGWPDAMETATRLDNIEKVSMISEMYAKGKK